MAAFASNASRSNCNFVSSEGLTHRPRKLAAGIFTDLRPVISLRWLTLLDDDVNALVIRDLVERLRELEDAFFGEVLRFDHLAHSRVPT